MLAPILKRNQVYREVYFPNNTQWYDYFTGSLYEGGRFYFIDNTLDMPPPLFLK